MKIAIDIDDTLFQTHDLFLKYCNENGYNTNEFIENDKFKDYKVFMKVWYEFVKSKEHLEIPPIEDSIKIVNQLAKDNELYIITARDDSIRKETLELLEKYYDLTIFKKIINLNYTDEKIDQKFEVCKLYNIKLIVDDNLQTIIDCANNNIISLLMDYKKQYTWNKTETLPKNATKVYSWENINNKINNYETK